MRWKGFVKIVFCAAFAVVLANPAAAAPRALVFDHSDRWTTATGAALLLDQAGFEVSAPALNAPLSLENIDLVFLASFISEHSDYAAFIEQNKTALLDFVAAGGVLVQMTQADQTEASPAFLPEALSARRSDPDFSALHIISGAHPLLEGLPQSGDQIQIPQHLDRGANWEAFSQQSGFRVLLASSPDPSSFALLEGAHGSGRVLLTSLFLDKLYRNGSLVATPQVSEIASQFFSSLADYVTAVRSGTAPEVIPTVPPEPLPFVPGSWTIAVLPDTQNYASGHPEIFEAQTRWIVENQEARNIIYVLHLGDIVNNNNAPQWENARRAMRILDDAGVPYAIVPGNHDYGDNGSANNRQTLFNDYFPIANYRDWPTFGGAMDPARMDNTYHLFSAGNQDWLVLALEWGPRNQVVQWANSIVEQHPDRKVILITHAYMYFDETRYDWQSRGASQSWNPYSYGTAQDPDGTNDGEDLWQKLVRKHPGFVMTLNGHVLNDGLGRLSSWGDHTNIVHQMLVNYQMRPLGGEGYLRLMEFLPDGKTVHVKAYSPWFDHYLTDPQNQFILDLDPPPPPTQPAEEVLLDDPFNCGIPRWTPVQPPGTYFAGPLRWEFDLAGGVFTEGSNLYTDSTSSAPSATAAMLINDTIAPESFTFRARLTAGDDDGFGLIFGYTDPTNFFRITFARQNRTSGYPGYGWRVDRKVNDVTTVLFGHGTAGHTSSFINRPGVPFEVTARVDAAGRFSLIVLDDPEGTPHEYRLVQNQSLPAPPAGRVGLVTWGMSGGSPDGFQISQLDLTPTPLASERNDCPHWISLIPAQANGANTLIGGNSGQPAWWLSAGAAAPYSGIRETSGTYAPGTDIQSSREIDFTGPTLISGDPVWTDYRLHVRIIPEDSTAQGVLVRYQDPRNFYRITLAAANSLPGSPPPGLSVQKVTDGNWVELYRETQPRFLPQPSMPYDLLAEIRGQELTIRIIENPTGVGATTENDPINIPAPTIPAGGIGLFTWQSLGTQFAFARVSKPAALQFTHLHLQDAQLSFQIQNPSGLPYHLEFATNLAGPWQLLHSNLTAPEWDLPLPDTSPSFWRLRQN